MGLGKRIQQILKEQGLGTSDVAAQYDLSQSHMSRVLNDNAKMSMDLFQKIQHDHLEGVNLNWLFYGTGIPKEETGDLVNESGISYGSELSKHLSDIEESLSKIRRLTQV
ncbi:MAG: hypothetical protein CMM93_08625 [Rickettsiales bacterium]|nr:hypothetical protein [Rickettsiales bacterium]